MQVRRLGRAWQWIIGIVAIGLLFASYQAYQWWHDTRTEEFRVACRRSVARKDWKRLEAIANDWVKWDARSSDGWIHVAEAKIQVGDVAAAADALGRVQDSHRTVLQVLAHRADLLFTDLDRPIEAVETWQRMLRINPHADLARQRLIYFYALTLQRRKMVQEIHAAMRLQCEPPEAYSYLVMSNVLNFSDGAQVLGQWRFQYPDSELFEVAQAVYTAKNTPSKSLAMFGQPTVGGGNPELVNACLKKYPQNLEVLAFHLDRAVFDGDQQRVAELLKNVPKEAEEDSRFWRYRGWYLASAGNYQDAEDSLQTALRLNPLDWRSRLELSPILRQHHKPDEAEIMSRLALKGKELELALFAIPNARAVTPEIVRSIVDYLTGCGDHVAETAIKRRTSYEARLN